MRKGERRSWGTEEIPYYGELHVDDTKPKKKNSETKINKKDVYGAEIPTKVHSMESINSEPSDFRLVTKKKKSKKRQTVDDSNFTQVNHNYSARSGVFTTKKGGQNNDFQSYRKGSNLVNDNYYNSQSVNNSSGIHNQKSRRKSTSSMPPSDKSDLSDSDSVHSLPIESKKSQNASMKQKNQKDQPQSYAEITKRKKSQGITVATATTITTTYEVCVNTNSKDENALNSTTSTSSNTTTSVKKPKTKHKPVIDFPELVPTTFLSTSNTTPQQQQISYSQSLVSPVIVNNEATATSPTISTTPAPVEYEFVQPKQVLYKSKSMDNDSNTCSNSKNNNSQSSNNLLYNSIDQYPALEKTVKRSNSNNNTQQQQSQQQQQPQVILDCENNEVKPSSNEMNKSCAIEVKKKSSSQMTSSSSVSSSASKKSKKPCSSSSSSTLCNKNINRPAVIILNDDPNRSEISKISQFTFGDFKEDELKFLGNSEEPTFNMNSTLKSNQDINVSLESDNGYSSSLNQSAKTMDNAFPNEEDIVTTDSQNNNNRQNNNNNNSSKASSVPQKATNLGNNNKMNKKIITCSEIENSLTSQVSSNSNTTMFNFNFIENAGDDEEEYMEDEDDETNATTSTNIGDDDNDAIVNENYIELDISTVNNKASCILSFKPPPKNMLLPSHNERIIDFIGSGKVYILYIYLFSYEIYKNYMTGLL